MASPLEFISTGIKDITFDVYDIEYSSYPYNKENISTSIADIFFNAANIIYPEPILVENPNKSGIKLLLKFNHLIDYDLNTVKSAFKVKDSINTEFPIDTTEVGVDNSEILFNMPNFSSASGNMFIQYDRSVIELDCLNEGSRFAIESFSFEFTPDLAPPEGYLNENITVNVEDILFDVKEITSRVGISKENLSVGIADIVFTVTKVGDNPL